MSTETNPIRDAIYQANVEQTELAVSEMQESRATLESILQALKNFRRERKYPTVHRIIFRGFRVGFLVDLMHDISEDWLSVERDGSALESFIGLDSTGKTQRPIPHEKEWRTTIMVDPIKWRQLHDLRKRISAGNYLSHLSQFFMIREDFYPQKSDTDV